MPTTHTGASSGGASGGAPGAPGGGAGGAATGGGASTAGGASTGGASNAGNAGNLLGGMNPGVNAGGASTTGGASSTSAAGGSTAGGSTAGGSTTAGVNTRGASTTGGTSTVTFAPGTPAAGGTPPAVAFALNPGTAVGSTVLDYIGNKAHNKLYNETIKCLFADPKNKFDMLSDQIQTLLNLASIRLQMVCSLMLMLFGRNLCECHAQFSLAQMKAKALTYMGTPTRLAQDDSSFAQMLWNSISDNAVTAMSLRAADFTVNGMTSGLLLFKSLLINSRVDATHDPMLIRRQMTELVDLIRSLGHDIRKFNLQVRSYQSQLAACGQTFPDVTTFIYEAYLDHPSEQLVRFVEMIQDKGRMTPPGHSADQLMDEVQLKKDAMDQAEKLKALKNTKQDEVVALKAQVDTLTKSVNKFKRQAKSDKKSSNPSPSNSDGKGKHKRNPAKPFPDILNTTPAPTNPNVPKIIDEVKYWWCTVLKKWCKHSPDECRLKDKGSDKQMPDKQTQRRQTVRATMARIEESSGEESADEE